MIIGLILCLAWPILQNIGDIVTTPDDVIRLVLLGGPTLWLVWRATRSSPPRNRWTRFAEKHGLERLPSTPFATSRLGGLWDNGQHNTPVPISIHILRHATSKNRKAQIRAHVSQGLPWGLCIDPSMLKEPMRQSDMQGIRSVQLAERIDETGL